MNRQDLEAAFDKQAPGYDPMSPGWTFTAVEPSKAMLAACRERATAGRFAGRRRFHAGYVDGLPPDPNYHAATSFPVSQFIVDRAAPFYQAALARKGK